MINNFINTSKALIEISSSPVLTSNIVHTNLVGDPIAASPHDLQHFILATENISRPVVTCKGNSL